MVRLENAEAGAPQNEHDLQLREDLKKEVREEMRRQAFRGKWGGCCTCFTFLILFLFAFGLFVAHTAAKTGLVDIPIFSSSYKPSKPTRVVVAKQNVNFENIIAQSLGNVSGNILTIAIQEEEATGLLQEAAKDFFKEQSIEVDFLQVAMLDNSLEWYLLGKKGNKPLNILAHVVPKMDDQKLFIDVVDLELGSLKIHPALPEWLLNNAVNSAMKNIPAAFVLKSVNLEAGAVKIGVEVDMKEFNAMQ